MKLCKIEVELLEPIENVQKQFEVDMRIWNRAFDLILDHTFENNWTIGGLHCKLINKYKINWMENIENTI